MQNAHGSMCWILLCRPLWAPLIQFVPKNCLKLAIVCFSENIPSISTIITSQVFFAPNLHMHMNCSLSELVNVSASNKKSYLCMSSFVCTLICKEGNTSWYKQILQCFLVNVVAYYHEKLIYCERKKIGSIFSTFSKELHQIIIAKIANKIYDVFKVFLYSPLFKIGNKQF